MSDESQLLRDVHVLIVEDDVDDAKAMKFMLENRPEAHYSVESAQTLGQAIRRLQTGHIDAVLLDLHLPDSSGIDLVTLVRTTAPDVAVIVVTGWDDGDAMKDQLKGAGADDVLMKPTNPREVSRKLQYSVAWHRSLKERDTIMDTMDKLGAVLADMSESGRFRFPRAKEGEA